MARPILLAVDDDVNVLEAVVQDLRRHYGSEYRVMRAASGQAALDTLGQVKAREEPVALLLSDQRMPGMTGVEFLERSREQYPEARRVLLTAYADTEAAIQAINTARIHYYLNKPWDPPEEKLYPVLNDLLDDWKAGYRPAFEGLRVIGHRWSLRDHTVRSFLSCNHIPYRWFDISGHEEALKLLEERRLDADKLPVVLFPDGSALVDPELEALATKVGLSVQATQEFYDLIIVGAGPAGLAAVQLADGREVSSHVVVLAPGVQYRKLEIPGGDRLTGRGIYYGAALVEAAACKDEDVFVVGGANSAGQASLYFSKYARNVTMLVRGKGLTATMSKYLIDEIDRTSNIVVRPETQVLEAMGDDHLEKIRIGTPEGEPVVPAASLFVFIGAAPRTEWLPSAFLRDDKGFLLAGPDLRLDGKMSPEWKENREPYLLESSVPGVFVAGDVRHGSVKRVASAVGEGSIAVQFVHQYLAGF